MITWFKKKPKGIYFFLNATKPNRNVITFYKQEKKEGKDFSLRSK